MMLKNLITDIPNSNESSKQKVHSQMPKLKAQTHKTNGRQLS